MKKQLAYKSSALYFERANIAQIAKKFPTPFYLYSEKILKDNYLNFYQSAVKAKLHDPLVCFALKSNSNKSLLKILANLGCGADIVSVGEFKRAVEAGIPVEKIVFSGVGKTREEIKYTLKSSKHGPYSFNVESIEELELISEVAAKLGKKARICFRLNPVVQPKTHKYISTGNKTHKFGMLLDDVFTALEDKKIWKHCTLVGLSIHIGSQLLDLKATEKAIIKLCEASLLMPNNLEFLDVGGGLGVDYHPDDSKKMPSLQTYMNLIHDTFEKHYYNYRSKPVRVVFEPGRKISAKAGILVMSVLRNKVSEDNNFLIVDGGMNDFMRPSLYGAFHDLVPVKKAVAKKAYHVVGPICETSDCFGSGRKLPALKNGDLIVLADTGAYGYSMGSNYNLRGRPAEILFKENGELKIVNKAQDYEELL